MLSLDIVSDCRAARCRPFLEKWRGFWNEHAQRPVALAECAGYYAALRPKSQAMVRQAQRRYTFRAFLRNDELASLEVINLSRPVTSEGPMRGWQAESIQPEGEQVFCPIHRFTWYGGFDAEGVLRGYCRLVRMGELAVVHDLLAHAEGATGVLNGLFAHMADVSGARYISYHVLDAGSPGRRAFKERVGFREYDLEVVSY